VVGKFVSTLLVGLLLLGCGASGSSSGSSTSGSSGGSTGGTSGSSGSSGSTGHGERDTILASLRADPSGTVQRLSFARGFPIHLVEGGYLVVSTDGTLPFVAGDFDGWAGTALTRESGFSWAVIPAHAGQHYKLTDRTRFVADPLARSFGYDTNGEISTIEPGGKHLERYLDIGDANMKPRPIRVLVPSEPITHVLYAHDGQNLFDPAANFGGWKLQDSAPAGMLIVGIDNTSDRFAEYTPVTDIIGGNVEGGRAAQYADFIENTVRPLIRAHYGETGPIGTMGSSLGGLVSLVIADRYPSEYRFAASLSGTAGWGSIDPGTHHQTVIELYAAHGHEAPVLYIDSGGGGTTCADSDHDGINDDDPTNRDNFCENQQLHQVLLTHGYTDGRDVNYWYEPNATHDEAHWAARVFRPLGIFAGL
jgi:predicted alpha/beta superfamily hydrolase